jgi:hypothetical protein
VRFVDFLATARFRTDLEALRLDGAGYLPQSILGLPIVGQQSESEVTETSTDSDSRSKQDKSPLQMVVAESGSDNMDMDADEEAERLQRQTAHRSSKSISACLSLGTSSEAALAMQLDFCRR